MSAAKGLGRGLDALFGGSPQGEPGQGPSVTSVPLSRLQPNPQQPRRHFDEKALSELADSIRAQGIMQPLLVRPVADSDTLQIVAGERRWRAAQLAGLEEIPVYVRHLTDEDLMVAALIENLQREDLNPIEEAEALQALRQTLNLSQEALAERLGKSRPAIANALRLLRLSAAAREDVRTGRLSAGHARCLLGIDDDETMELLRQRINAYRLTVRETEDAVIFWRANKVMPWEKGEVHNEPIRLPRRKKSAQLRSLQQDLTVRMGLRATVSGTEEQGRIAFSYSSHTELQNLLERLGLNVAESAAAGETGSNAEPVEFTEDEEGVCSVR